MGVLRLALTLTTLLLLCVRGLCQQDIGYGHGDNVMEMVEMSETLFMIIESYVLKQLRLLDLWLL
jgi:hypothetical protein